MTAHIRGDRPRAALPSAGAARGGGRCAQRGLLFSWRCVDIVLLYAVCPSCHLVYHVPTSGSSPRLPHSLHSFAVHALLQGGRYLLHPPDCGPSTPVSAACGAGVPGGPGQTPLHRHALANMGRRQGAGAWIPHYRRRRRSNLRPACALERPQGPGPGMTPGCVQSLTAPFLDLQLCLGLIGVTCVCRLSWAASLRSTPVVVSHRWVTVAGGVQLA
jgi:hypothetical protein